MTASAPRRVVHVITGLGHGGAEGVLTRLVTAQRSEPVESVVVSLTPGGGRRDELEAAGCEVHDLGMQRGRPAPAAIARLASIIRRTRPVAVQGWMYHADLLSLLSAYASGMRRQLRLYWGVRCSDMQSEHYGRGFRAVRRACALLSARPDGIVANSFAGRDVHIAFGYSAPGFEVIPNGIDVERFKPDTAQGLASRTALGIGEHELVVFTAARVDPMKGYGVLAEAARKLPALRFVVAGAGTDTLDLPPNVLALGHRADLAALLPAADVLLSASLFGEGFSNSIAEGMAAGLCPVASDVGDARRVMGGTGEVYAPADVDALASVLHTLAQTGHDAVRARGLSARARIVEHFSVPRMVAAFDALHLHDRRPGAAV